MDPSSSVRGVDRPCMRLNSTCFSTAAASSVRRRSLLSPTIVSLKLVVEAIFRNESWIELGNFTVAAVLSVRAFLRLSWYFRRFVLLHINIVIIYASLLWVTRELILKEHWIVLSPAGYYLGEERTSTTNRFEMGGKSGFWCFFESLSCTVNQTCAIATFPFASIGILYNSVVEISSVWN